MQELASLGIDRQALLAALQAQNDVRPAGVIETGDERSRCASPAPSGPSRTSWTSTSSAGGRMIRLGDIADRAARLSPTRRSRCSASTASRRSGSPSPCATAATCWRSATTSARAMAEIMADLPIGIEPILVADQAVTVDDAIGEFMESLVAGGRDHPGGELPQPRRAARRSSWRCAIPLTLAIVFADHAVARHRHAAHLAGRPDHRAGLLVDDAMTTTDAMITRLAAGDDKPSGRDLRLQDLRRRRC